MSYQAVICNFYDYLEHFATLREQIEIRFLTSDGKTHSVSTKILDIQQSTEGEFIVIQVTPERIRLDHLLSVGGIEAGKFPACALPSSGA